MPVTSQEILICDSRLLPLVFAIVAFLALACSGTDVEPAT